jgi:1-acyl-sn-glycerol-3-phosphate acyltransferase
VQKINYYWRLIATATAFTLFGLGGVIVPLLALPVLYLLPGGVARQRVRARKLIHWTFLVYIHIMRLLGILTWEIEGQDRLQHPGILVLANHPTLLDVVFMVAFIPNADCIVKSRLLTNPAMRGFVALTGYITNDGADTLIDNVQDSLQRGSALIVFPEGTRSRSGQRLSFQRGAANIIIRAGVVPSPVIINCEPATLSKQHKWYHIPKERKFHLSFRVLDDINVDKFLTVNASLGARQLTRHLENFFAKELHINEHGST